MSARVCACTYNTPAQADVSTLTHAKRTRTHIHTRARKILVRAQQGDVCVGVADNFFIFMIMLNFIIAIIVEAYMKVVTSIADMEADQEFCSDVTSVLFVSCKSMVLRWPGHMQIMDMLQTCRKQYITYGVLRLLFPKWRRRGMLGFLHHYARYDFVLPSHEKEVSEHDQAVQQTVAEIEERLAVMLGVPIPTQAERLMENKRLEMIGEVLPHACKHSAVLADRMHTQITRFAGGAALARRQAGEEKEDEESDRASAHHRAHLGPEKYR